MNGSRPLAALGVAGARAAGVVASRDGVVDSFGDPDERFALASVTKLLSAYACLVACEEGSVALDDAAGPPGSSLAHLLAHASGLGRETADGVLARPGERRIYSNAGVEAAAAHLAAASVMAFPDYLAAGVLEPLAMTATTLYGSPAHGASSSAGDLGRFAAELLSPTLVSSATLASAVTVWFAGLSGVLPGFGLMNPCDWGIGFEVRDAKDPHWTGSANSPLTFGHFGQSGACVWVDPVADLALVALVDRPFGTWAKALWPELSDAVLAAMT